MKALHDKVSRLIESSELKHKAIVERYISLYNRKCNALTGDELWDAILIGELLKARFEKKFGEFIPRHIPRRV